jgi:hypothetical protein
MSPWIQSTRSFLSSVNMTMQIPQIGTLKPLREKDQSVMDIITQSSLSLKEITIFNNTRLFLQITSVSEISNTKGTSIYPDFTSLNPPKKRPVTNGSSKLIWPVQPPPNRRMWRVWIKGIKQLCKPNSWYLLQHLGHWTGECSTSRNWYGYYINSNQIQICQSVWELYYNTLTKCYYRDSETTLANWDHYSQPIIPDIITSSNIMIEKMRNPIQTIPSTSSIWSKRLHHSIEFINPLPQVPLCIRIKGYEISNDTIFQWEVFDHQLIYLRQQSIAPRLYNPNKTQSAIIGLVSCLSKLQQEQWAQALTIYTEQHIIQAIKITNTQLLTISNTLS